MTLSVVEQQALAALLNAISTLASPLVGGVIVALSALMVGDWITAVSAAARRKDVEPLILGEFLRTHVLGRLVPIVALVILASFTPALTPIVALGVASYTTESVASIRANLALPSDATAVSDQAAG